MSTTLHTWRSDRPTVLASARWQTAPGEDLWSLLLRVLAAMTQPPSVLEPTTGRINVAPPDDLAGEPELWTIQADRAGIDALRARVDAARAQGEAWIPTEVVLRTRAQVLVPTDIESIDEADHPRDELRADAEPLPIRPVTDDAPAAAQRRAWWVLPDDARFEEEAPVYLQITCDDAAPSPILSLRVMSSMELWQAMSFDGLTEVPGGSASATLIREAIATLAERTGGRIP